MSSLQFGSVNVGHSTPETPAAEPVSTTTAAGADVSAGTASTNDAVDQSNDGATEVIDLTSTDVIEVVANPLNPGTVFVSTASGLLIFSPGEETYAKECNDNTPMMASDEETTTPEDTEFKHHVHHIHSGMDSDDILGEGKQSGINDPSLQNDYLLNFLEKDR